MQKAFIEALKANGVVGIDDCIQAGGKNYVITEKPNQTKPSFIGGLFFAA